MSYLSKNISVFPSTERYIYPQGKLTSENNFINILNSLKDYESYVLKWDLSGSISGSGTLKVIIHGYYFVLKNFTLQPNQFLSIIVEEVDYGQLVSWNGANSQLDTGTGDTDTFTGINVTTQNKPDLPSGLFDPQKYKVYSLQITDATGNIINRYRFNSDSVYYKSYIDSPQEGQDKRPLSQDLDARQYKLIAGNGIAAISNNYNGYNTVSINEEEMDKLDCLEGKGSKTRFVYFSTNGIATPTDASVGNGFSTNSNYSYTTDIYLNNGEIVQGRTVFMSKDDPSNSVGKLGDIWFKYAE